MFSNCALGRSSNVKPEFVVKSSMSYRDVGHILIQTPRTVGMHIRLKTNLLQLRLRHWAGKSKLTLVCEFARSFLTVVNCHCRYVGG